MPCLITDIGLGKPNCLLLYHISIISSLGLTISRRDDNPDTESLSGDEGRELMRWECNLLTCYISEIDCEVHEQGDFTLRL